MHILAVIPARGGSKRIPGKNIKLLAGKPLIAYAIDQAHKSQVITRTIVSTDDRKIARVARELGAEVPFLRPAELAGDKVTDLPVFKHALEWLEENEGYRPEIIVHLRPTAPLRTVKHIEEAVRLLLDSPDADAVRSVCPSGQHPLKSWAIDEGMLRPFIPEAVYGIQEAYNWPRQELPKSYIQNGAVDVTRYATITDLDSMTGRRIKAFVMGEEDSVNIDTPLEWAMAEELIRERQAGSG